MINQFACVLSKRPAWGRGKLRGGMARRWRRIGRSEIASGHLPSMAAEVRSAL